MKKLILISFLFLSVPAFAGLELRVLSSSLTGSVDSFNNALETSVLNTPNINGSQKITGWDVRYSLPIIPLSFGYRSEMWNSESSGSGTANGSAAEVTTKFQGSRNSVLAGFQILSIPLFSTGLIAHYALDSKMEFKRSTTYASTTRVNNYAGKMDSSYGLGIEGSAYLWKLVVTGELGYTVLKASKITDDGEFLNSNMNDLTWDYSGTYMMLSAGIAF